MRTDYTTLVAMIMSNSYNSSVYAMVFAGVTVINLAICAAMILGHMPVIHIIQALFLAMIEFAVVVLVYYGSCHDTGILHAKLTKPLFINTSKIIGVAGALTEK
jgi:hypothetical protein